MIVNFVSVWTGTKYSPEYVPILHDMVSRNLSNLDQRHFCITDRPHELPDGIQAIPADPTLEGWWQKLALFSPDMPWSWGERLLFMDLDSCVVGRLEDLAQTKGIALDWHTGALGSAVMCWDHGEHRRIWLDYIAMSEDERAAMKVRLHGDQDWMTEVSRKEWTIWPKNWILSYRSHSTSWPPAGSKVVCFHGVPKPHEAGGWVPNVWKPNGFTSLPEMTGVNVSYDTLHENVRANAPRDLPWFTGYHPNDRTCVLVCGAPSMRDSLGAIKDHKRRGTPIVTVNNALKFLAENGVTPTSHAMLDARPENAAFVENPVEGVRYFVASQCHPSVFDALEGQDVIMWHNAIGDGDDLVEITKDYVRDDRPLIQVPGGCTVGLRAMYLIFMSGFRKIHIYGMDSSYDGEQHHAYPQPLNDKDAGLNVVMGNKQYHCARWMARQAEEFRGHFHDLEARGMTIFVHGKGLIPDMARAIRRETA